jgi:hypothetical protein
MDPDDQAPPEGEGISFAIVENDQEQAVLAAFSAALELVEFIHESRAKLNPGNPKHREWAVQSLEAITRFVHTVRQ